MSDDPHAPPADGGFRIVHSSDIGELAGAMAAAQSVFPPIPKTRTATIKTDKGTYTYSYADLADLLEGIRPGMAANGLAVVQPITHDNGVGSLVTLVIHKSGQWIRADYNLRLSQGMRDSPQAWGSAITYARRYSLSALIGVSAETDEDGAAASDRGDTAHNRKPNATPPPRTTSTQKPAAHAPTQEQRIAAATAFVAASESFDDLAKFADNGAETIEDEIKRGELQNLINARLHAILPAEIARADAARLEEITEWLNGRDMLAEHARDIIQATADRTEQLATPAT